MSIKEITMYTVECDSCGTTSGDNSEFAGWTEKFAALDEATAFAGFIEHEEKHYCPNCTQWNEDESELIPKEAV